MQAHWHVPDSLQATRRDEMLSSALFMFPSMISTSLPHRRASYVSGVVRYILASLFCFFVLVMTLFQSPVSHDYIRSILLKFQVPGTCNNFTRQGIDHLWIFWSYFPYVSCLGSQGLFSFQICQSIAQKRNPNAADSFNDWQLPLSKLKTSQVSEAYSGLLTPVTFLVLIKVAVSHWNCQQH